MHTIESVAELGFQLGIDLVEYNWQDAVDWKAYQDSDLEMPESFSELGEKIAELAWQASENYHQYSPLESFAKELNEAEDSEELWNAYDEGVYQGIEARINEIIINFPNMG